MYGALRGECGALMALNLAAKYTPTFSSLFLGDRLFGVET
jgi:hypothetical protein